MHGSRLTKQIHSGKKSRRLPREVLSNTWWQAAPVVALAELRSSVLSLRNSAGYWSFSKKRPASADLNFTFICWSGTDTGCPDQLRFCF